jgi:hypothetical protein
MTRGEMLDFAEQKKGGAVDRRRTGAPGPSMAYGYTQILL